MKQNVSVIITTRMHYVPRIFHSEDLLDAPCTDICSQKGSTRLLRLIPEVLQPVVRATAARTARS